MRLLECSNDSGDPVFGADHFYLMFGFSAHGAYRTDGRMSTRFALPVTHNFRDHRIMGVIADYAGAGFSHRLNNSFRRFTPGGQDKYLQHTSII